MRNILCPICTSSNCNQVRKDYYKHDLYKCPDCELEFCIPLKAPDSSFYSQAEDDASILRHTKLDKWTNHPSIKSIVLANGNSKTLLDIGCGNGAFIDFASSKGFTCTGIDFDRTSIALAKKRNNPNSSYYNIDIMTFIEENRNVKFDVISCFEVIEHLENPKQFLEEVYSLLKEDGYFIGSVPNEDRFFAKSFNMSYAQPPYHLTFWTKQTVKHVLSKEIRLTEHHVSGSIFYGYVFTLLQKKTINLLQRLHLQNRVYTYAVKLFFLIPRKLESIMERSLGRGSSIYFEFRKRAS